MRPTMHQVHEVKWAGCSQPERTRSRFLRSREPGGHRGKGCALSRSQAAMLAWGRDHISNTQFTGGCLHIFSSWPLPLPVPSFNFRMEATSVGRLLWGQLSSGKESLCPGTFSVFSGREKGAYLKKCNTGGKRWGRALP